MNQIHNFKLGRRISTTTTRSKMLRRDCYAVVPWVPIILGYNRLNSYVRIRYNLKHVATELLFYLLGALPYLYNIFIGILHRFVS